MSIPRQVVPGRFYLITRRCTQREFLLRPDADTNNAFIYCLTVAAEKFGIDVVLPIAMSNHHHTVIYDRDGTYPQFIEHFHKLLARCQNTLRGRHENFWASGQASVVHLVDSADVLSKLLYVATNPVKDHLVAEAHQWPGVNGLRALLTGRPLRAKRPRYFRKSGKMPAEVTLHLAIPEVLEINPELALRALEQAVRATETATASERRRSGLRIVGRRKIREQSWRGRPSTTAKSGGLNPSFAARDPIDRAQTLASKRAFIEAYHQARMQWLAKKPVPFPAGTYWLRRFMDVPVHPANH